MAIRLEAVTPEHAAIYRDTRLRALHDSPSAFGSTYARESRFTEADWQARAAASDAIRSIVFLAFDDAEPRGLIRCTLDDTHPDQAQVTSMWVAAAARKSGLGTRLLQAAQLWAAGRGVRHLLLTVVSNNQAAMRFYQRNGFTPTGRTEPYPNDPDLFEYEMSKPIP